MRIASLVPHATELLFALGLGEQVLAVTHECDYPPAAGDRERLTRDVLPGGLSAAGIDQAVRERTLAGQAIYALDERALRALRPDLIVTQAVCPVCAVSYEDVVAVARTMEPEPRVISLDPRTLQDTLADVDRVAQETGTQAAGACLHTEALARLDRVRLAVRNGPRPRVAAIEWLDPVYVAAHWTPEMIEVAGGKDVLGVGGGQSQVISWDELRAARPEVVVLMPCGYDAPRALKESRAHSDLLRGTGAERVVAVDASSYFSRPGPRLIDGVELLAHILHPGHAPTTAATALEVLRQAAHCG